MAEDITSLEIRVLSDQVEKADQRLKRLEKTTGGASRSISSNENSWKGHARTVLAAGAAYVSVASAINGFRAVIQKTREFQVLRSALVSSTGGFENMELAWRGLLDFAATTPYTLDQAVSGFNKLVNLGLDPSQRAMTSYGDTAAAMGKDLSDMIEAVADAATGEFERLKEFGIKAKTEGDKVIFTFRGVKTEVQKNAADIEEYLIKLGENNFAGNMANRMETLDGKFSNLEDTWDTFLYNLGTSTGAAEAFGDILIWVADQVANLDDYVSSGEMAKEIEGWTIATEGFRAAWADVLGYTTQANQESAKLSGSAWDEFMTDLQGIPPLVESVIAEIATDLWSLVETAKAVGTAMVASFKTAFTLLKDSAGTAFSTIRQLASGDIFGATQTFANETASNAVNAAIAQAAINAETGEAIDRINENTGSRLDTINQKLEDTLIRQEEAAATADLLRINAENAATNLPEVDLGQFRVTAPGEGQEPDGSLFPANSIAGMEEELKGLNEQLELLPVGSDKFKSIASEIESAKAALDAAKGKEPKGSGGRAGESFDSLQEQLSNEEAAIKDSYDRRLQIVKDNTVEGSMHQAELSLSRIDQQEEEHLRFLEKNARDEEALFDSMASQNDIIKQAYEARKSVILGITEQTEQEKAQLLADAHSAYIKAMHRQQQETVDRYLEGAAGFFNDLSKMGSAFGKTGFKIAQGAAIAEATINMYASAVAAYKTGAGISPVLGPVFAAAALAAGAAQIANIKSQQYQGEYAHGGMISAGSFGMVGETGPELVKGPALVTSKSATSDKHKEGGGKNVEIQIHNYSGEKIQTRTSEKDQRQLIELIVGRAREEVANDLRKGGNPISGAIEGTYGVSRGRRVG